MKFILLLAIAFAGKYVEGALKDKFYLYEIVSNLNIHSITKRDAVSAPSKRVIIPAYGKNFTVELRPAKELFTPKSKVVVIHGDGRKETVEGFQKYNFLTGHVEGEPLSKAAFHLDDDGVATGVFQVGVEEYYVEPVRNHISDDEAFDHRQGSMVVYRREDVIEDKDGPSLCGAGHPTVPAADDANDDIDETYIQPVDGDQPASHSRRKRATVPKSCRLVLVADYKFYGHMGQSNIFTTANYMANVINRANLIYRSTTFGSMGAGFGFEIESMVIHDEPSTTPNGINQSPYNVEKASWGTTELLEAFSMASINKDFCLGHLFTSRSMQDSILGLAYIASSRQGSAGGICSPTRTVNGVMRYFNVGWTSALNKGGGTITFTQMSLVTSHEFGHNWGSEHDPTSGSCAPGTFFDDGKYLMYAYSVTGEDPNNDQFSSCSRASIAGVLSAKASSCFQETSPVSLCGNGRIDADEQCDGGFLGSVNLDPCCSDTCTLNTGAVCSPANYPCCRNCQLASPGLLCSGLVEGSCKEASYCDGNSLNCPAASNKPDSTPCLDSGSCRAGECVSFCEFRFTNSCVCDTVAQSCLRCCRGSNGICSVFDNNIRLADGRSCVQGYCENGQCKKVATDMVERFWEFIDAVDFDFLAESFKTNMVACVTCFSLIIYVPICIIIWCVDRKRRKDWEKQNQVHVRTDRGLNRDEDKRAIVSEKPKTNRSNPAILLDPSEYLNTSQRSHPSSRNQIHPLNSKPGSSHA